MGKLHFFAIGSFVLTILFVLTLVSGMAVLYGNDAISILVLSTKKQYSSFSEKVFLFQKICFKVKVLKTFKIFTDFHIKTWRSLKQTAILKIPSTAFERNLCFFCCIWIETPKKRRFPNSRQKRTQILLAGRSNHLSLLSIWWLTLTSIPLEIRKPILMVLLTPGSF